jgi:hypothetical protein
MRVKPFLSGNHAMKKNKTTSRFTVSEMQTQSAQSLTDWDKADAKDMVSHNFPLLDVCTRRAAALLVVAIASYDSASCLASHPATHPKEGTDDLPNPMTDKALDEAIAADAEERGLLPDWTKAGLVLPESKLSVNLRLDREVAL